MSYWEEVGPLTILAKMLQLIQIEAIISIIQGWVEVQKKGGVFCKVKSLSLVFGYRIFIVYFMQK